MVCTCPQNCAVLCAFRGVRPLLASPNQVVCVFCVYIYNKNHIGSFFMKTMNVPFYRLHCLMCFIQSNFYNLFIIFSKYVAIESARSNMCLCSYCTSAHCDSVRRKISLIHSRCCWLPLLRCRCKPCSRHPHAKLKSKTRTRTASENSKLCRCWWRRCWW